MQLGSWNLRNLSLKRDLNEIAEVIKNFDLIAIQEVRSAEAIERIAKILNYKFAISEPICSKFTSAHQTGKRKEQYAFLWGPKIKLISDCHLVHGDQVFVRSPFIGYFAADKFDFIFSTIHVVWGKKSDRQLEINHVQGLLNKIIDHSNGEGDIILCGDFNTPPEQFSLNGNWKNLINEGTVVGSGSRYDNIWINSINTKEYSGDSGVLKVACKSDHYPIWAKFNDFDDDEGIPDVADININ